MKRKGLILASISLGIIYLAFSYFNILRFYKYPTTANEPGIKEGSRIVWSNLLEPQKLDYIVYTTEFEDLGKFEAAMRLVGEPGDIIRIEEGDLYVNDQLIDEKIELRHSYKSHMDYFNKNVLPVVKPNHYFAFHQDSIMVFIDEGLVEKSNFDLTRIITPSNKVDKIIKRVYKENWNIDNFGPLEIPKDKYFVIGDNRGNSIDSRVNGLVEKKDVLGKIILIW